MKKTLYGVGDLVVFNEYRKFGDKNDRLFHIHSMRHGTCTNHPQKQYWYNGYLLKIDEYESEGLPQVPMFATTLTNASESQIKSLEKNQV